MPSSILLSCRRPLAGLVLALAATAPAAENSAPPAPSEPAPPPAAPPTHKVRWEPFKVEMVLDGAIEAREAKEIAVSTEVWTDLAVVKAAQHGARVQKDDVILELETKKIDEAILDMEQARKMARIALRDAEADLQLLEKSTPLDLAAAERSATFAREDLERFLEKDRAFSEKSARKSVESAEDALEYAREELRQLEKMYKADDLTEETEEIILKRQRDQVERMTFQLEESRKGLDDILLEGLPRREVSAKEGARRQDLALEKARASLPSALQKQRLQLDALRKEQVKSDEKLKKIRKDRQLLSVKAPFDGIVYLGKSHQGGWAEVPALTAKLRPGGSLGPKEVVMTIVKPGPLLVKTAIPEKDLHLIRPGLKGAVLPTGYPALRLPATLGKWSSVPTGAGQFAAEFRMQPGDTGASLFPGMTCKVHLVPYAKKKTILVPAAAVFPDEVDSSAHAVVLFRKEGAPEMRKVVLGEQDDKVVEVLEGLEAGDEVLLEKPRGKP